MSCIQRLFSAYIRRLHARIVKPGGVMTLSLHGTVVTVIGVSIIEVFISHILGTKLIDDLIQGGAAAIVIACPSYMLFGTIMRQNIRLSARYRAAFRLSRRAMNEVTQKNEELKLAKARLAELANSDHLTGLTNRRCFEQRLTDNHNDMATGRPRGVLVLLDLNGFKVINDEHGHDAGDAVLRHVAVRIRKSIGDMDGFGARLGGDEFAILLREDLTASEAMEYANKLRSLLKLPHAYRGHVLMVSASISLAVHPTCFHSPTDAYIATDEALMVCKRTNKDGIAFLDSAGEYSIAS